MSNLSLAKMSAFVDAPGPARNQPFRGCRFSAPGGARRAPGRGRAKSSWPWTSGWLCNIDIEKASFLRENFYIWWVVHIHEFSCVQFDVLVLARSFWDSQGFSRKWGGSVWGWGDHWNAPRWSNSITDRHSNTQGSSIGYSCVTRNPHLLKVVCYNPVAEFFWKLSIQSSSWRHTCRMRAARTSGLVVTG